LSWPSGIELSSDSDQAAVQAVIAFGLLKRYLLVQDAVPPRDIQIALGNADNWRDRLGHYEVGYEQAEDKYNMEDWNFAETERKYMDDMLTSTELVSVPASIRGLTEFPSGVVESPDGLHVPDFVNSSSILFDGEQVQNFLNNGLQANNSASLDILLPQQHSYSMPVVNLPNSPIAPGDIRPHSESDVRQLCLHWSHTRERIGTWLLDAFKHSNFQKAQLRNVLSSHSLGVNAWWTLSFSIGDPIILAVSPFIQVILQYLS
jgi:hypothetical protein